MFPEFFEHIPEPLLPLFEGADHPWEALDRFNKLFASIQKQGPSNLHPTVVVEGDVVIGEGTVIEPGVVIKGPTIIGKHCQIRAGAYIRGHVWAGDRCVIGHTTELVRSILFDDVRVDHFNYVGDSILGNGVHFGAGAKVANLRFDGHTIMVDGESTDRTKFGAILGDQCQLGVNTMIGPGVLFEKHCWWLGQRVVPSGTYSRDRLKMLLDK
ncbi:hypothetical protein HZA86_00820 [Candidatus Uhrbacteria bacterium]|nr:hypothetical protein [Candidatus Uhrbacteria bacterium]